MYCVGCASGTVANASERKRSSVLLPLDIWKLSNIDEPEISKWFTQWWWNLQQFEVLEYLLTLGWVDIHLALVAAAKDGLTEVIQILLRDYRTVGDMKLDMVLYNSRALEHAAAAGHIDILAMLLEHCRGYWGNQCTGGSALWKAAEAGRMAVVVMLAERYEGPAVGKALGAAIVNGHGEMVEFLFRKCPSTELVPAVEAAAVKDLFGLLERILVKSSCEKNIVFVFSFGRCTW
ncbi:hypothetical protein V7S43_009531 [Phytophthora oleae]|uniref:Ankyrin repeat-containing domain n=1 Tax=Phytophthora oleae TaxID=2107226 RepID=A0ABD3FHX2_9STRA